MLNPYAEYVQFLPKAQRFDNDYLELFVLTKVVFVLLFKIV